MQRESTAGGARRRPPGAAIRVSVLVALVLWWLPAGETALANRFGPPWQARVIVDRAVVYSRPDRSAPVVGPLEREAIVAVLGELPGADGAEWTAIPDGFIPSDEVAEWVGTWVAEVAMASVSIYAKPFAGSGVRRVARAGSLLRVTGVSPGLEGDPGVWWATTEGYVPLGALRAAADDAAAAWRLPDPQEAPTGWWGEVVRAANVRAGPTTEAPVVGELAAGARVKVLAEEEGGSVGGNAIWYRVDGGRFAGARVHSSLIRRAVPPRANTTPPAGEAPGGVWIVVDRSDASLTLVRDGQAEFTTYVALGKAGVETPTGTYATLGKYRADDMTSASVTDAEQPYDLPNVPFTQYYREGGFALHGTYWHDLFGTRQSQGCVNLTLTDAAYLFEQTLPAVPEGVNARWVEKERATAVVIVD